MNRKAISCLTSTLQFICATSALLGDPRPGVIPVTFSISSKLSIVVAPKVDYHKQSTERWGF